MNKKGKTNVQKTRSVPFVSRGLFLFLIMLLTGGGSFFVLYNFDSPLADSIKAGAWKAWPEFGMQTADPYLRIVEARFAFIPVGPGNLIFVARTDSQGRPLDAACHYVMTGRVPLGVTWSLTTVSEGMAKEGENLKPSRTASVTSLFAGTSPEFSARHQGQIIFDPRGEGHFILNAAPFITSGNWIPLPPLGPSSSRRFFFILRLYETPLMDYTDRRAKRGLFPMPQIERRTC